MNKKKKTLSVVICTYDRVVSLEETLKSIKDQSERVDEVVLVVAGEEEKVRKLAAGLKLKNKLVSDPMKGLAVARDLGWRRASGNLVAWIDDDVVLEKNWAKFVRKAFADEGVGGVSGPTIIPEELLSERMVFWWYPYHKSQKPKIKSQKYNSTLKKILAKLWVGWMLDNDPFAVGKITKHKWWSPGSNFEECLRLKGPVKVDYLEACNMILRRELVEKVGGYDLGFKGTSEWCEVDLARKVRSMGYTLVFDPKVRLEHHVSQSGVYAARKNIAERGYNYMRFLWRELWR